MSRILSVRAWQTTWFFCGAVLLGFAGTVHADPKPLTKDEQAKVDKAIDKGVAFLKRVQHGKGDWPPDMRTYPLGQTLLPAYALLEAGRAGQRSRYPKGCRPYPSACPQDVANL